VILFIALLIGYPWHILSTGSVLYLLSLPLGLKSYRDQARAAEAATAAAAASVVAAPQAPSLPPSLPEPKPDDRPERLH
jgi:CDP-diacylglycerol---serine O-phosphatidyltransferase